MGLVESLLDLLRPSCAIGALLWRVTLDDETAARGLLCLLGFFNSLALAQPYSRAAAVFVDEFDATRIKSILKGKTRFLGNPRTAAAFHPFDCWK
jgi:hypothetical protein